MSPTAHEFERSKDASGPGILGESKPGDEQGIAKVVHAVPESVPADVFKALLEVNQKVGGSFNVDGIKRASLLMLRLVFMKDLPDGGAINRVKGLAAFTIREEPHLRAVSFPGSNTFGEDSAMEPDNGPVKPNGPVSPILLVYEFDDKHLQEVRIGASD